MKHAMKHVEIVGMGPGEQAFLTFKAQRAIEEADLIVGASRLVESLADDRQSIARVAVKSDEIAQILQENTQWDRACLLMSGDVGLFSGTRKILEALESCEYEVHIIPGISSAQLFAARLGKPWQDWRFASAHGIDCNIEDLVGQCGQGGPVFLVTGGNNSAASLCARLDRAGMGRARVWIGEKLSYPDERIVGGTASELSEGSFDDLSVMLIEPVLDKAADPKTLAGAAAEKCIDPRVLAGSTADKTPDSETLWPFASQGIPDQMFERGEAPMTKQEIRAVALAKLRISKDDVVYDIGAGTGSVAIEAALLAKDGYVYAIERHENACELVRKNARRFDCSNLEVVEGTAPEALVGLPAADVAFIGGSGAKLKEILDVLVGANPKIRICITCITLETIAEATSLLSREPFTDFETCQLLASRSSKAGRYHLMKAENPVFIVTAQGAGIVCEAETESTSEVELACGAGAEATSGDGAVHE